MHVEESLKNLRKSKVPVVILRFGDSVTSCPVGWQNDQNPTWQTAAVYELDRGCRLSYLYSSLYREVRPLIQSAIFLFIRRVTRGTSSHAFSRGNSVHENISCLRGYLSFPIPSPFVQLLIQIHGFI